MKISLDQFQKIIFNLSDEFNQQKDYLSELDQKIGDGDHGTNMARGFEKIKTLWKNDFINFQQIFQFIGTTLMSSVGGASGPLYGMAFFNYGKIIGDAKYFDFFSFKQMVESFANSIGILGKSQVSEKTMLDVWSPLNHFLKSIDDFNLTIKESICSTIADLVQKTKSMLATKGRASFLKERSVGHLDPGSVSSQIILNAILKNL